MKMLICILVFCVSCVDTAYSRQRSHHPRLSIEEYYVQSSRILAKHRYSHAYRYRHRRDPHVARLEKAHASTDGRSLSQQEPIRFPYTTGTTILDAFEGRKPVIGRSDCAYPGQDWYQGRAFSAWAVPD